MNWSQADFVVATFLLLSGVIAVWLIVTKVHSPKRRAIFGALCIAALVLLWAELAVGIIGTPLSGS